MNAVSPLLPVAEALARVLASAPQPLSEETVPLAQALGRTLAHDLAALRTQPPFDASAMDGYALRFVDLASTPTQLTLIGASAAGHGFAGAVGPGQAVRIFTGAPVPPGADTVIIQENTSLDDDRVTILQAEAQGRNIRRAGLDFAQGDLLLTRGLRLGPCELALAAAMNHASLPVTRRPRIALLATGDELVRPGEALGPDQIVTSNTYAVGAYAQAAGAEVIDLGIAGDTFAQIESGIRAARDAGADVLVTLGGASVGDHDLVQTALAHEGMELGFWRIAMRPGKPLMHGRIGDMRILGLPGNPVSAIVCGVLFLIPLIRALAGDPQAGADHSEAAVLGCDLPANDSRQDYLRATLHTGQGLPVATPFGQQDSSMLRVLANAHCLVARPPQAPAARAGDACRIIRLAAS
jgi:molybdopterin molybdotransferase